MTARSTLAVDLHCGYCAERRKLNVLLERIMASDTLKASLEELKALFGEPSQVTLGAAVFCDPIAEVVQGGASSTEEKPGPQTGNPEVEVPLCSDEQLESYAKGRYEYFAGDAWANFGAENWLATWNRVYQRVSRQGAKILDELKDIEEPSTNLAASQLTENHDEPDRARDALAQVFDSEEILKLHLYQVGDTEAITGVLIAAVSAQDAIALVFLMD